MKTNEKVLILGSLFHDIGKFEQRCTNKRQKHEELGMAFVHLYEEQFLKILDNNKEAFQKVKLLIGCHHEQKNDELLKIIREADHLSASERVGFGSEEPGEKWNHKFLSSLFSKIYLKNKEGKNLRYYQHKPLDKEDYKILIPEFEDEKDLKNYNYQDSTFKNFNDDLKSIFSFYNNENDFQSFINLLLILFEKYMWCLPDFTGTEETDISLYNHLKDVAGISLALYKSKQGTENLNLIIGDMPGIQNYIFDVTNKKPAQILRGRSIYVQILTRQLASKFLEKFDLTEANLIMLAGGKFYILAPDSEDFETKYAAIEKEIEQMLIENFNYELNFSSAFHTFSYKHLMQGQDSAGDKFAFGDIIEEASYKLLGKRHQIFNKNLIEDFDEKNFVLNAEYYKPEKDDITDKIKCAVTDKPIMKGRESKIDMPVGSESDEKYMIVDKQVQNEWKIGKKVTENNIVIELENAFESIGEIVSLKEYQKGEFEHKIILNPNLDKLLSEGKGKDILRNALIIEVANYCTKDGKTVMDFEGIEKTSNGAKFLTMIKGDVDNLGLIMSNGLVDDNNDITAISRTTTLSNHLKYFFSFSLNGLLKDWDEGKLENELDSNKSDQKVYTVYAGGDDLLLVCPQSASLKLVDKLNSIFNEFVCYNPEVHISWSLTNFKHNTPVRIVAEMAEKNQKKAKGNKIKIDDKLKNTGCFEAENDKASVCVFDTVVKNDEIQKIIKTTNSLKNWESNKIISIGVLRNLLFFADMMRNYKSEKNTKYLMYYPLLTYMISRKVKRNGQYPDLSVKEFFEELLSIKNISKESKENDFFYPSINNAIYLLRK